MGFNLENLSNSLLKMGSGFLQMGTFYSASKAINSCSTDSIFSGGCYGGGGYCGNSFSYGGYGGAYGYDNPLETQFLMGQAYGEGYALAEQMAMLNANNGMLNNPLMNFGMNPGMITGGQQTSLQKTNNPAAEKVDANQDTSLAEQFEQNVKDKKSTQFVDNNWKDLADGEDKDIKHMDASDNFAKSYIMHMDKTSGNSNGEITLDEFKQYNIKTDLGADATDAQKTQANKNSEIAFKKLDQNGDGKLDWKEMSSMFTVYDSVLDGKYDGKISKDEVDAGNKALLTPDNTQIEEKLRIAYEELYPPENS